MHLFCFFKFEGKKIVMRKFFSGKNTLLFDVASPMLLMAMFGGPVAILGVILLVMFLSSKFSKKTKKNEFEELLREAREAKEEPVSK